MVFITSFILLGARGELFTISEMNRLLTWPRLRGVGLTSCRGLVSPAFHCTEEWAARLKAPVLQKIKLGEYFVELDRKFSSEYRGSAIDVDIFAQAAESPGECEQLEELLYKLRRTPHTIHSPPSTNHAAVRALLAADSHLEGGEQIQNIVKMLDDRINYGLFLDEYTAVLLLDALIEKERHVEGARVASHLMLQEEDRRGLAAGLGKLAVWRYLERARQSSWFYDGEIQEDDNPDEVIRVRAKGSVPNNYDDEHFDLRDPHKITGKTLVYLSNSDGDLDKSLKALGLVLWGKDEEVKSLGTFSVAETILEMIKDISTNAELHSYLENLPKTSDNVDEILLKHCQEKISQFESQLIENQKKLYKEWNSKRDSQLEKEYQALLRRSRIEAMQNTKEELTREEEKLFFFENFDKLEMEKDEKLSEWKKTFPRTNWSLPGYFQKAKFRKVPGEDRKVPKWERREAKRGPPK